MPNPTPLVLELSNRFRRLLLARERRAATAIVRYYGRTWQGLQKDMAALQASVNPTWTPAQIMRHERMAVIQRQVGEEMERFSRFADDTVRAGKRESLAAGDQDARVLLGASFPREAGIHISFAAMPRDAVEALVGFLQDGSPVRTVIEGYVGSAAQGYTETMARGLASGWNPRRLARALRSEFGTGLTDTLRLARTEQLRAYRASTLWAYQQSGMVIGWERKATLDDRTCIACLMLDGKFYGLDEYMDDHPNGRCLPPGQLILTDRGWIPIERIGVGDLVLTHRGHHRPVIAITKRVHAGELVWLYEGPWNVKLTPEHPVLTTQGWRCAKDLSSDFTLLTLNSIRQRVSRCRIVQPLLSRKASFFKSSFNLSPHLCQPGSSSTARRTDGNAKSMLYFPTANSGNAIRPQSARVKRKSLSCSVWFVCQLACRVCALLRRAFSVCDAATSRLIALGSYFRYRLAASLCEIGSIPHLRINLMSVLVLMPASVVSSRYIASSSIYRRCNHLQIGSPSRVSSSCSHLSRLICPRFCGDFLRPNSLARWRTALAVRLGNNWLMASASFIQKCVLMICSSSFVQGNPAILSLLLLIGNIIHQGPKKRKLRYRGAVYNLQVEGDESYIAGGIIVHNCAMLPATKSYAELGIDVPEPDFRREMGQDWFLRQDEATQRRMMGNGMYDAWREDKFKLEDIPKRRRDPVWGDSWGPRSLGELAGD